MINIIPKPLKAKAMEGSSTLTKASIVTTEFSAAKTILERYLSTLSDGLGASINIVKDDSLASEEYRVEVGVGHIYVFASTENGAIYGVQTIIQLGGLKGAVSSCRIEDKPRYAYRGFMLDSARHFFTVADVKNILDIMSSLKLNTFHWHLTDDQGWRIEIKKRPLLTQKGTTRSDTQIRPLSSENDGKPYGEGLFYTQEDIKTVVKYAKSLGINIIPEIDMPGHLVAAISCYPELSCEKVAIDVSNRWGVLDTIGCCGSPELYEFIKDVLDEVCALFPYEYFHIGGDEVPKNKWAKCPKCQAKMADLGLSNEEELQGYFNNFVADYIKPMGKKLVGWNEILKATTLSKDTIIQWWTPTGDKKKILNFLSSGGKAILSKHQNFYMDHAYSIRPLSKTYNFNYSMLGINDESAVLGIEAPQWTEYVPNREKFDFNTFPRMMALAENAWTMRDGLNYADFEKRLESNRNFFQHNFEITMANPFFYRGMSVKSKFFKGAIGWTKWSKDPQYELKLAKKNN